MTSEVIQKLQERATILTQERKRRGRNIPEDLATQENIRSFKTLASHPVSDYFFYINKLFKTKHIFTS